MIPQLGLAGNSGDTRLGIAVYSGDMDFTKIKDLVARLTPEEIRDGLWMISVFEDRGSMTTEQATSGVGGFWCHRGFKPRPQQRG